MAVSGSPSGVAKSCFSHSSARARSAGVDSFTLRYSAASILSLVRLVRRARRLRRGRLLRGRRRDQSAPRSRTADGRSWRSTDALDGKVGTLAGTGVRSKKAGRARGLRPAEVATKFWSGRRDSNPALARNHKPRCSAGLPHYARDSWHLCRLRSIRLVISRYVSSPASPACRGISVASAIRALPSLPAGKRTIDSDRTASDARAPLMLRKPTVGRTQGPRHFYFGLTTPAMIGSSTERHFDASGLVGTKAPSSKRSGILHSTSRWIVSGSRNSR